MKAVILAGGFGTRMNRELELGPKPMVPIGGIPIICHIMQLYSSYGINEFIVCAGYRADVIKDYFSRFHLFRSDISVDLATNTIKYLQVHNCPWKITIVDTGERTLTAGRIQKVQHLIGDETFLLTYGDGFGNVDIKKTINFHKAHKKICTVTAVHPSGRYGNLEISRDGTVTEFAEKPLSEKGWINGGFFVVEPSVFKLLGPQDEMWEQGPMKKLADQKELKAFHHSGFWYAVDTPRDRDYLATFWDESTSSWRLPTASGADKKAA